MSHKSVSTFVICEQGGCRLLGHQGHQHHQGHKGHQGLMGHQSELKRHVGPEDPIEGHLAEQQELARQLGA